MRRPLRRSAAAPRSYAGAKPPVSSRMTEGAAGVRWPPVRVSMPRHQTRPSRADAWVTVPVAKKVPSPWLQGWRLDLSRPSLHAGSKQDINKHCSETCPTSVTICNIPRTECVKGDARPNAMEATVLRILSAALMLFAAVQASDARIVVNRIVANGLVLNRLATNGFFQNKLASNGMALNRLAANGTSTQGLLRTGTGEVAIDSGVLVAVELPR